MSMELMLRQRACLQRALAAVDADGTVRESWQTVAQAQPCLLERVAQQTAGCQARCYFSPDAEVLQPGSDERQLRAVIDGATFYVRSVYRLGSGEGRRRGMLVAELES